MAVPLLHEERALGVLEVARPAPGHEVHACRDGPARAVRQPGPRSRSDLLQRARRAQAALAGEGDLAVVARVAETLEQQRDDRGRFRARVRFGCSRSSKSFSRKREARASARASAMLVKTQLALPAMRLDVV